MVLSRRNNRPKSSTRRRKLRESRQPLVLLIPTVRISLTSKSATFPQIVNLLWLFPSCRKWKSPSTLFMSCKYLPWYLHVIWTKWRESQRCQNKMQTKTKECQAGKRITTGLSRSIWGLLAKSYSSTHLLIASRWSTRTRKELRLCLWWTNRKCQTKISCLCTRLKISICPVMYWELLTPVQQSCYLSFPNSALSMSPMLTKPLYKTNPMTRIWPTQKVTMFSYSIAVDPWVGPESLKPNKHSFCSWRVFQKTATSMWWALVIIVRDCLRKAKEMASKKSSKQFIKLRRWMLIWVAHRFMIPWKDCWSRKAWKDILAKCSCSLTAMSPTRKESSAWSARTRNIAEFIPSALAVAHPPVS